MSTISSSTTSTTAFGVTADTTGALVIQTGATPTTAMTIDTSQNVGIGTSSPATKLDVRGELSVPSSTYSIRFYNIDRNNWSYISNTIGASSTDSNLVLGSAAGAVMTLDGNGRAGIGTTSINAKLNVKAINNTYAGGALSLLDAAGTSKNYITAISSSLYFGDNATADCAVINQYGVGLGGNAPTSGLGIRFPATQSASSDANTLDDYEEGSWAPTWNGGSVTTYDSIYIRIGRLVLIQLDITLGSSSSTSSSLISLPFTPTKSYAPGSMGYTTYASTVVNVEAQANPGIAFRAGNTSTLQCNSVAGNRFIFSISYVAN
jgi:hypothetical protein